jgi:hypothetical protein
MQPFSLNQTGTLLRRHLAEFVAAIDTRVDSCRRPQRFRREDMSLSARAIDIPAAWSMIDALFKPLSQMRARRQGRTRWSVVAR